MIQCKLHHVLSTLALVLLFCTATMAQSEKYEQQKNEKLQKPSPFEAIISGVKQDQIIFQDDYVVAFLPLRKQAPVHLLIVPKKRIPTLNEVTEDDSIMLGRLLLAAKNLAKQYGIDKSGYRIAMNTNEDAGQSVFHVHLHLLGGMLLGPMAEQTYKEK